MLSSSVILLTALPCLSSATSLIVSIPPSVHLPQPNDLSPSTHATLYSTSPQANSISTPLTVRSTLEFHNLSIAEANSDAQSFLLSLSAPSHVFASYRVDLIPDGSQRPNGVGAAVGGVWETYLGSPWSDKGPILAGKAAQDGGASGNIGGAVDAERIVREDEQVVNIEAKVLSKRQFYQQRPRFNPLTLLMNPMLLVGLLALGLTFGMPYLMENSMRLPWSTHRPQSLCILVFSQLTSITVDPELRAEFEEQKKKGPLSGMHKAIQDATGGAGGAGGTAGGDPVPGAGSIGNFDLASWMAGAQKENAGVSRGTDAGQSGKRRKK